MAAFGVVIPAYNEAHWIWATIQAIAWSLRESDSNVRVVVVDDCSEDATAEVAELAASMFQASSLSFEVVRLERRSGVALARNAGMRLLDDAVVIFMDAHCVPGVGALNAIAGHLASGRVVIAGPVFVAMPGCMVQDGEGPVVVHNVVDNLAAESAWEFITDNGLHYGRAQRLGDESMQLGWSPMRPFSEVQRVEVVTGACVGVHRSSWFDVVTDGWDEGFTFPWGAEDVELSLRAWRLGKCVESVPNAFVAHKFNDQFSYGIGGSQLFNHLRLAVMYFHPEVVGRVINRYRDVAELGRAMSQVIFSDALELRRKLSREGPAECENLTAMLAEFGGLSGDVGWRYRRISDRS